MALYKVVSGASAAAAAPAKIATVNGIKTMLQVLHPSRSMQIVEWGISFDAFTAQAPFTVELCHTTTVAATVTASVANDVEQFTDPPAETPGLTLSTTGTGYNATAEGTVVAPVRNGDIQLIPPTSSYLKQFPLSQEWVVPSGGVLRIRVTATVATVNCLCYVVFGLG